MKAMLFLAKAEREKIDTAMEMIEQGRSFLKSQGLDQWQTGYPDRKSIQQDLEAGKGYFLTDGENCLAYLCMDFEGEPAYDMIKGAWLTGQSTDYMVIHRLAFRSDYRGKGLSMTVFRLAEEFCREKGVGSIRVDTDEKNVIMQHVMRKAGFIHCGSIWFAGGDKLAFEKIVS